MTRRAGTGALDAFLTAVERGLRSLAGGAVAARPNPGTDCESSLTDDERKHAAGLMRVNHCGEVCAQALYEGQSLTAREADVQQALAAAAAEERDHLAWCRERLAELDSRPSILAPLFYVGSYAMGAAAGLLGDRVSLGFVEATEDQVGQHLEDHLGRLPPGDDKSRAILEAVRADELRHGDQARLAGAAVFPGTVKAAMRLVSRVMTDTTYRL